MHLLDLACALENALSEKKARGEFGILPGGPHGDGNSLAVQADFERFFNGQQILKGGGGLAVSFLHRNCEDAAAHTEPA
jgi:hypothetical protein